MSGSSFNLDTITTALQKTHVSPNGVTFAGKSLKLDNENDGKFKVFTGHFTTYIYIYIF